jgi:hypothetical protein
MTADEIFDYSIKLITALGVLGSIVVSLRNGERGKKTQQKLGEVKQTVQNVEIRLDGKLKEWLAMTYAAGVEAGIKTNKAVDEVLKAQAVVDKAATQRIVLPKE